MAAFDETLRFQVPSRSQAHHHLHQLLSDSDYHHHNSHVDQLVDRAYQSTSSPTHLKSLDNSTDCLESWSATQDDATTLSDGFPKPYRSFMQLGQSSPAASQRCRKAADPAAALSSSSAAAVATKKSAAETPSREADASLLRHFAAFGSNSSSWSEEDDLAQEEALRAIAALGAGGRANAARVEELKNQVLKEQSRSRELELQLAHERECKEVAEREVRRLQTELERRMNCRQGALVQFERRPPETMPDMTAASSDSTALLRRQLEERDKQLDLKDKHIARLLKTLRQQQTFFMTGEDESDLNSTTYRDVP